MGERESQELTTIECQQLNIRQKLMQELQEQATKLNMQALLIQSETENYMETIFKNYDLDPKAKYNFTGTALELVEDEDEKDTPDGNPAVSEMATGEPEPNIAGTIEPETQENNNE
jgi:predicted nucleic acid-binding protein